MHLVRLFAALGGLLFASLASAQTTFVCGSIACSAFGSQPITGIDNLVVDGDHFDVTFSNTQDSTFLFSSYTAASGQPLTGVDAGNALDAFYATQMGPNPGDDGPGIVAQIGGADVEIFNIVTAFDAGSAPGLVNIDMTEPFLGIPYQGPTLVAPEAGDAPPGSGVDVVTIHNLSSNAVCQVGGCTVWTPIAAPEISSLSAASGLTLLLGSLLVLRGRRIVRRVPEHQSR